MKTQMEKTRKELDAIARVLIFCADRLDRLFGTEVTAMGFSSAPVTHSTVFAREDLIDVPNQPGRYAVRCPAGADTILSPKASGDHELRDLSYVGGLDETCCISGDCIYFPDVAGARFAWRLMEAE